MPMNVRNFWIDVDVDGKKSPIETGPRSENGGFQLRVLQRDNGLISEPVTISGKADNQGNLVLEVKVDEEVHRVVTKR